MSNFRRLACLCLFVILQSCSQSYVPPDTPSSLDDLDQSDRKLALKYPEVKFFSHSQIEQLLAAGIPDERVDSAIDPSITGADRLQMRKAMLSLPPWSRSHFTYIYANGRAISNVANRTIGSRIYHRSPANLFINADGKTISVPGNNKPPSNASLEERRVDNFAPVQSTNSGPYRQLYYYPPQGGQYSFYNQFMYANIPCGATNSSSVGPYSDQGYVYAGGYNSSGSDSGDFGVIYSPANQQSNLFFNLESIDTVYADDDVNFPCGDALAIVFGANSNTQNDANGLYLEVQAYSYDPASGSSTLNGTVSIIANPENISSWTSGGFLLKATVSLAQKNPPSPGYVDDGYTFGINGAYQPDISLGSIVFTGETTSGSSVDFGIGDPSDPQQNPSQANSNSFTAYSVPNTQYAPSQNGYADCTSGNSSCFTSYATELGFPVGTGSYYEIDGINADSTPAPTPKPSPTVRATPKPCFSRRADGSASSLLLLSHQAISSNAEPEIACPALRR